MSEFVREANDPDRTPVQHAQDIYTNTIRKNPFFALMGTKDSGASIIVDGTLKSNAGDTVIYHFVPTNEVDPIIGQDVTITGNENTFYEFTTKLKIDEFNHAFKMRGKLTKQRTIFNARKRLTKQIENNWSLTDAKRIVKALSGGTFYESQSSLTSSTTITDRVNGANRCFEAVGPSDGGNVTEANSDNVALFASVSATDTISPLLIKGASDAAWTSSPYKMTPIRLESGDPVFILYLSFNAARNLTEHPMWQTYAMSIDDMGWKDAITKSALGVIDSVIIKKSEHIIEVTDGTRSIARNLLIGGGAAVLGYGEDGTLDYTEQWTDYKREIGVTGTEIRGEAKLSFTDQTLSKSNDTTKDIDYGVAQIVTASDPF